MTETALQTSFTDPDVAAAMTIYERLQPLQDALGLKDLTVPEMQLFAMVAQHTGLDPFTRQIYAIKRGGKVTHQTGIDGYRSSAERNGQYAGSDEATYEECGCGDEGSPTDHPKIARVVVRRILPNGHVIEQTGVARWHELKPEHKKPQNAYDYLDAMWWRMPFNQLAKCAEANGLRKAFPRVLGGVYIAEEMEQDRTIEGEAAPPRMTLGERAAAKAAAIAAVSAVEDRAMPAAVRWESAPGSPGPGVDAFTPPAQAKIIDLPPAEPMTEEVSAKYVNADELAGGARAVLRDDVPPWTRERLHAAVESAKVPGVLVTSTFAEVAEGRKRDELTEADWREIATRLGLGA
jgi:phage recombination protein Bet